ncbi:hypothetical protein MXD63_41705, partial [Frankia sp. Cpl3]|nr:hypothetical protein [Frankia sp. Cpl3]
MNQANPVLPAPPPISSQKKSSVIAWMSEDSFLGKLWRNAKARYSLGILLVVIAIGITGPWLAPHDPTKPFYEALLTGPSADHPLGTDSIGRDVLSRLLHGARVTIIV